LKLLTKFSSFSARRPLALRRIRHAIIITDEADMAEEKANRDPKDLRYRKTYFPKADNLVFTTDKAGFIPLPILLRKLIRHLSSPELRVLTYLHLRVSRHGICYPPMDEMLHELGLASTKHLKPHLKSLEEKGLISTHVAAAVGRTFFLVHDPRVALERMLNNDKIPKEELLAINDLCEDLNQPPIAAVDRLKPSKDEGSEAA
jgi:DNA-binding MarR family transcriptional regulator